MGGGKTRIPLQVNNIKTETIEGKKVERRLSDSLNRFPKSSAFHAGNRGSLAQKGVTKLRKGKSPKRFPLIKIKQRKQKRFWQGREKAARRPSRKKEIEAMTGEKRARRQPA